MINVDLRKYLSIGFKHLGRGYEAGDCFNLAWLFYQDELGISLPDFTGYSEDWGSEGKNYFLENYKPYGFVRVKQVTEYRFGDLLLFNTKGAISHCGVVIDPENYYFLHTTKTGTATHSFYIGEWASRLRMVLRHKRKISDDC